MLVRERIAVRWQIYSMKAIAWVGARGQDLRPEVHARLADRYYKLAALEETCGHDRRAALLRLVAMAHEERGPREPFTPRAAALAMPKPTPPVFTDVRGKLLE